MLTIEASHIYFGGGYTLLCQILEYLEQEKTKTKVYISYDEVYNDIYKKNYSYIEVIKTTTLKTFTRYCRKRRNILFFCNLPPFIKNQKSITYFHNIYFLDRPKLQKKYIKEFIYFYWVKYFSKNTDVLACQTLFVRRKLEHFSKTVMLLPFFDTLKSNNTPKIYDFCYVGSAKPHKNYTTLLDSVELLLKKHSFKIAVTIEENLENKPTINRIQDINQKAKKEVITNYGLLNKHEIIDIYSKSNALIFPSLKESFGLPIIEALMCDLMVLSSDLPFSYELINEPIVFDPYDKHSITQIMSNFLKGQYNHVKQYSIVENKLDQLIQILKN